jgi:hypothetical protein
MTGVVIIGLLAIGWWALTAWASESTKVQKQAAEAKSLAEAQAARAQRRHYLLSRHGGDLGVIERIEAGEVWIGQTAEELRDALGAPDGVDERQTKSARRQTWKYLDPYNERDRIGTRVTLEDGIVTAWTKRD